MTSLECGTSAPRRISPSLRSTLSSKTRSRSALASCVRASPIMRPTTRANITVAAEPITIASSLFRAEGWRIHTIGAIRAATETPTMRARVSLTFGAVESETDVIDGCSAAAPNNT